MWRDLDAYLRALIKQWAGLITGPTATLILLIWQVFEKTEIAPWVFWMVSAAGIPVAGFLAWRDEHRKVGPPATDGVDIRVVDNARQLRRELAASFEGWPESDPHELKDLVTWARKLAQGFAVTGPGVRKLEGLRAEASDRVKLAVRTVAKHYDAAADIVNPVLKQKWVAERDSWGWVRSEGSTLANRALEPAATETLRKAVVEVRQCLKELHTLTEND